MANTPNNLRPSVSNLRDLGNFTQMFRWGVAFEKIPDAISAWAGSIGSEVNLRAESATIPEKTGETTVVSIRGNEVRQPGKHTYSSPFSMTVAETIDVKMQNLLREWHNLCWESENGSTGKTEMKNDLEATIALYQLDNLDRPIYKYTLYGCFLETANKGDFDGSTSDPMKPNLSIAYDYFLENSIE